MAFLVKNENLFVPDLISSVKAVNSLPLPIGVIYDLMQCTEELVKQLKIVSELRDGLIAKYGTPDKEKPGAFFVAGDESVREFTRELNELGAIEFSLPIDQKVSIDLNHPKLKDATFTAKDMKLVSFYVDFARK